MIGVGTDIEEIERIRRSMENPRFFTRVFSAEERELFGRRKMSAATVAGNFCAKEAFSKALGTGIRGFSLSEISVLRDPQGRPVLHLTGRAQQLADKLGLAFSVSISHCPHYATAVVIAYRLASLNDLP
ncbi:MAG: holo-ACP synthase [Provencibacterium sp.]|jgi:holo-[acyl-carrier protein] synthase|nr:holo-ACP synthase [Provencibacterium sp.]